MTYEELGAKTKQKYPQYANVSDADLGKRVAEKYPEYESKITKPGLVESIGKFIAPSTTNLVKDLISSYSVNKQIPEANKMADEQTRLTQAALVEQDPAKKRQLLEQSRSISIPKVDTSGFSEDVEKGALNRGFGVAGEIGSFFVPQVKALKGATASQRIANMALTGATAGGIRGITEPTDSLQERGQNFAQGLIAGGVAGAATQGVFEIPGAIKNAFNKTTGSARNKLVDLYKSTLKQNIRDEKAIEQAGGIDRVVEDSIKYNIPNTQRGVESELARSLPEYNRKVLLEASKAEASGKTINIKKAYEIAKDKVLKSLKDEPEQLSGAKDWFANRDKMFLNKANEAAKPISANKLRINQDKTTGALLTSDIQAGSKMARKQFATELRNAFRETVPSLRDDTRRIELLYKMDDAFRIEPMLGITETAGALIGRDPLSSLLGFVGTRAMRSPGLKRAIAKQGIKALNKPRTVSTQEFSKAAATTGSLLPALVRYLQSER